MRSLQEITATLNAALGSPAMFELVSTRIALKTGVSLDQFSAAQDTNSEAVQKVLNALASMGYTVQNLATVANRKTS